MAARSLPHTAHTPPRDGFLQSLAASLDALANAHTHPLATRTTQQAFASTARSAATSAPAMAVSASTASIPAAAVTPVASTTTAS